VELPAADAGVEGRAGARGGEHGGAQAGRVHAAHGAAASPSSRTTPGCRRACSTSSPATAHGRGARRAPDVDKIAFTGSTEVGRVIRRETAGSGKKLSLELGGKSPFIVFEDADLDSVVEGVVDAIWFNQGEVCCAGSRLLVQEGVHDGSSRSSSGAWRSCASGAPLDKAVDMGAIVAPVQLERIRRARRAGARGGREVWQPSWACPTEGCFYPPTLVTGVRRRARWRRPRSSGRCWW
jgi:acyl-CoA reductase-like NAD-dependent aldehyde dehydrogenase